VGFVQILAVTIFSGELVTAMEFCMQNKGTLGLVMMEATMGYFGVYFYLAIIKRYFCSLLIDFVVCSPSCLFRFGAVVAIFVACCRKVVTLVLSFVIFPKPVLSSTTPHAHSMTSQTYTLPLEQFTWLYLLSGIMVFSGFGLNTYVCASPHFL